MATHTVRTQDRDYLAAFLGWFSIALGTAQVCAPRAMCRLVGASDQGRSPAVMRALGLRELTQGTGILTRPRPTAWVWSRVLGDALDLALLGLVAAKNPGRRARTAFAMANAAAVTVADVRESIHLSRKSGEPKPGKLIRKAVTIRRSREEVEAAWRGSAVRARVEERGASVRFQAAPRDHGTELAVEFLHEPRAGELGGLAGKLAGRDLATQLSDDLRRFKQKLETGEVVRSEATPSGHLLAEQLRQRAAQPLEEEVR